MFMFPLPLPDVSAYLTRFWMRTVACHASCAHPGNRCLKPQKPPGRGAPDTSPAIEASVNPAQKIAAVRQRAAIGLLRESRPDQAGLRDIPSGAHLETTAASRNASRFTESAQITKQEKGPSPGTRLQGGIGSLPEFLPLSGGLGPGPGALSALSIANTRRTLIIVAKRAPDRCESRQKSVDR
jgi:hypothetical protein